MPVSSMPMIRGSFRALMRLAIPSPMRNINARDVNRTSKNLLETQKKLMCPCDSSSQKSSADSGGFGKTVGELHSHATIIPDFKDFVHSKKEGILPGTIVKNGKNQRG